MVNKNLGILIGDVYSRKLINKTVGMIASGGELFKLSKLNKY